jgi:aminoglycoside 3-N-acetyltransferase
MVRTELQPITRSELATDLRRLGVRSGDTIMLHASVKAIGWIVGGPDVVILALLDVLGRRGTLLMYVAWEEDAPYSLAELPSKWQEAYLKECPPFDPARSRANRVSSPSICALGLEPIEAPTLKLRALQWAQKPNG